MSDALSGTSASSAYEALEIAGSRFPGTAIATPVAIMLLAVLRLVDLGSPLSLALLWTALGAVFYVLVRKLSRDGGFGNEGGL